ncbi:MAG: PBP1A family penicillin-binding protein [Alphaproteobacteria bacterium]|nr:PBP1A family penicillin-binding protein [Alphaproteobacteria bacterium]
MRRIANALLRLVVVLLAIGTVSGVAGYIWFSQNILAGLPTDLTAYRDWVPLTSVSVLDADGNEVDTFYVERREWVDLDTLPDHVWQAFVAAEDRRFFQHRGVDGFGIARALVENFRAGRTKSGASTLTQQLVKNLLVGSERSYRRKLKEAVLANRLERDLGKKRILELYLNYIALGSGNYGVEAAAQDYFDVPASELDIGQAALIAGLVPAPSRYSPRAWPEVSKQRRALVLGRMERAGYLTPEQAEPFLDAPIIVAPRESPTSDLNAAYVTEVRREIRRTFGVEMPFKKGFTVQTPLRPDIQQVAVQAVRDATVAHLERQGARGVLGTAKAPPAASSEPCFAALARVAGRVVTAHAGDASFTLADPDSPVVGETGPRPLRSTLVPGALIRVCRTDDPAVVKHEREPWSQAAAIVIEAATGEVVAVAGGRNVALEGFDRATQARRQPGSSFKPYVYAAALRDGHVQTDVMTDAPISLPGGNGKLWTPKNYGGGFAGSMTLRSALARSINTIAVRLALQVGVTEVTGLAHDLGVRTPLREDPTVALGSSEVTPLDQALAYTALVRGGVPTDAIWMREVRTIEDGPSARAGETLRIGRDHVTLPGGPRPRVLEPEVAYQVVDMMREVVRAGTARRAWVKGVDRGGKTGTTNGFVDAWFVGFTSHHVIAVWVGTDGTSTLGDRETGGKAALPAWIAIADALAEPEGSAVLPPAEVALIDHEGVKIAIPWSALAPKARGPLPPTP